MAPRTPIPLITVDPKLRGTGQTHKPLHNRRAARRAASGPASTHACARRGAARRAASRGGGVGAPQLRCVTWRALPLRHRRSQ